MGGDCAPSIIVEGATRARERASNVNFLFYGDRERVRPLLDAAPEALRRVSEICHTDEVIASDLRPSLALRQGRRSSMRLALEAVAKGEAACAVSAGNTGALMALAKRVLKTLPGIDRPAIASLLPTRTGECVMLDLGANIECDAENLVQFALMGAIYSRVVGGVDQPLIGLLNIGVEEMKGHDEIRTAAAILRDRPLPGVFHGFVEGNDITAGTVDVIVSDGFSGNVALKTIEGTASLVTGFLRMAFMSSLPARLGYLLARSALRRVEARADPRRYNGAMFLGLQGVCVKSHGGTDGEGFANAIGEAFDLVDRRFNERLRDELAVHYGVLDSLSAGGAPDPAGIEGANVPPISLLGSAV